MIRVAATDDHQLILNGLADILQEEPEVRLIAGYLTLEATRSGLGKEVPDILLLDVNLPDGNGIDACKEFSKEFPGMRIIGLTSYDENVMVKTMMRNGAKGYLLKNASKEELVTAIRTVHSGGQYLQNCMERKLVNESIGTPKDKGFIPTLTKREQEILELIADELTSAEIAEKLFVTQKTVETHRLNLMQKFGVRNSAGLVRQAINKGLLR